MPVFVYALRLALLFQNTFDTFKTLKPPPPSRSAKNGGQPSKSALAKRKRDMKGCLAVWMVWCCLLVYERNVEKITSIFVPFYDEVKSLLLLFFLFTRARGAEPIYLHIIRPVLKPYTTSLDAALDVIRMFGDIAFAMASYPIRTIVAWLPWTTHEPKAHASSGLQSEMPDRPSGSADTSERADSALHMATQPFDPTGESARVGYAPFVRPPPTSTLDPATKDPDNVSATLQYEIWQPPPSSQDDPDLSATRTIAHIMSRQSIQEIHSEEWRMYPAFPSAYPATPISQPRTLPARNGNARSANQFAAVDEGVETDSPGQDFQQSLLQSRVSLNPDLVESLSDSNTQSRVPLSESIPIASTGDASVSDEDLSDEDDEFDKTLRTPYSAPHYATLATPSYSVSPLPDTPRFSPKMVSTHPILFPIKPEEDASLTSSMDADTSSPTMSSFSDLSPIHSLPPPPPPPPPPLPPTSTRTTQSRKRPMSPLSLSPDKKRKTRSRGSPVKMRTIGKRPAVQPRRKLPAFPSRSTRGSASDTAHGRGDYQQPPAKKRRVAAANSSETTSTTLGLSPAPSTRASSRLRTANMSIFRRGG